MTTYRYMGPNEAADIGGVQVAQGQTFEQTDDAVIEAARQSGLQIDPVATEAPATESPAPEESTAPADSMDGETAVDPGNPAEGIHTGVAQEFADLSAPDTGIHGAVEQNFAANYGDTPTPAEPPAEAPAEPPAESPAA